MPTLRALIKGSKIPAAGDDRVVIRGLSYDSRTVKKGDLYFALPGEHTDGNRFIGEAFSRGAAAVITQNKTSSLPRRSLPVYQVKDVRTAMARIACDFYEDPSHHMSVIGVTGTNGKTTISYFLENIFCTAGSSYGVIGTINYRYAGHVVKAATTTPQVVDLLKLLDEMRSHHVRNVCIEVSSHALAMKRVEGLTFCGGIFTNLTRDHLDFHHTMNRYFKTKSLLFTGMNEQGRRKKAGKKFAIINTDDPYGRRLRSKCHYNVVTYGCRHHQDITAHRIALSPRGSECVIGLHGENKPLRLHLIGEYNIYNALAAAGAAIEMGISKKKVIEGLQTLKGVPGRMETVDAGAPFTVIIDYAHTNDALFNVLKAIRRVKPKRIFTVFGCGGDRDRRKRPIMGRIAVQESTHSWITLDNPRSERPEQIMDDILSGVKRTGLHNYSVIYDRKEAIAAALHAARKGDVVLVAGKGHERYQILKDRTIPFDDKKVVIDLLK